MERKEFQENSSTKSFNLTDEEFDLIKRIVRWTINNTQLEQHPGSVAFATGLVIGIQATRMHPEWALAMVSFPTLNEILNNRIDIDKMVQEIPITMTLEQEKDGN